MDGVVVYGGDQFGGSVHAFLLGVALHGGVACCGGELLSAYWRDSRGGALPSRSAHAIFAAWGRVDLARGLFGGAGQGCGCESGRVGKLSWLTSFLSRREFLRQR